jgi:hypothetical protein
MRARTAPRAPPPWAQSHQVIALAATGQIRLAVLTPWELRHRFVSVMSEAGVAGRRSHGWPGIPARGRPRHLHELRPVITTGADVMDQIFV